MLDSPLYWRMKRIPFSDLYFGFQPLTGYGLFRREEYTETVTVDVLRCTRCDVDVVHQFSLPRPGYVEVIHLAGTHQCDDGVWHFSSQSSLGKPQASAFRLGSHDHTPSDRAEHVTTTGSHTKHRFVPVGS